VVGWLFKGKRTTFHQWLTYRTLVVEVWPNFELNGNPINKQDRINQSRIPLSNPASQLLSRYYWDKTCELGRRAFTWKWHKRGQQAI